MTKKSNQKFWEIDEFFWEMQKFCRETPKKGHQKFLQKFVPPVSEVLDPLVVSPTNKLELAPNYM